MAGVTASEAEVRACHEAKRNGTREPKRNAAERPPSGTRVCEGYARNRGAERTVTPAAPSACSGAEQACAHARSGAGDGGGEADTPKRAERARSAVRCLHCPAVVTSGEGTRGRSPHGGGGGRADGRSRV